MHSSVMFAAGGAIMHRANMTAQAAFDRVVHAESNYVVCPPVLNFDDEEWERGHNMQVEALRREACGL